MGSRCGVGRPRPRPGCCSVVRPRPIMGRCSAGRPRPRPGWCSVGRPRPITDGMARPILALCLLTRGGVARWENRRPRRIGRGVRIVAIEAGVADALALGLVPVSAHAAVRTVLVVARLRTMTLGAELPRVGKSQAASVREPQRVVVLGMVAAQATLPAVRIGQPLVKGLRRLAADAVRAIRFARRVAGGAGDGRLVAVMVENPGRHARAPCIHPAQRHRRRSRFGPCGGGSALRRSGERTRLACRAGRPARRLRSARRAAADRPAGRHATQPPLPHPGGKHESQNHEN